MTVLDGFRQVPGADGELWIAAGFEEVAQELGLADRVGWRERIESGVAGGRGKIAFVGCSGRQFVLKQLRRGGVAGPLWRDRFSSRTRLLDNLSIPVLARQGGVRTPAVRALLLVSGPPGLWRGWLAQDAVPDTVDLGASLSRGPLTRSHWSAALTVVRLLHDAGIAHPDLNLGNLLLDAAGRAWVIDLDRCRTLGSPLRADLRVDGIRRIERSYLKTCHQLDIPADGSIDWPGIYAGGDEIVRCWERRRKSDDAKLARHRRSWRR